MPASLSASSTSAEGMPAVSVTASSPSPGTGQVVIYEEGSGASASAGPEDLLREMQNQDGDLVMHPIGDIFGAVPALPTLPSADEQLVLVTSAAQEHNIIPSLTIPASGLLESGLGELIDEDSMAAASGGDGGAAFPGGRQGRADDVRNGERMRSPRRQSSWSRRSKSESNDRPPSMPSRHGSRGGSGYATPNTYGEFTTSHAAAVAAATHRRRHTPGSGATGSGHVPGTASTQWSDIHPMTVTVPPTL